MRPSPRPLAAALACLAAVAAVTAPARPSVLGDAISQQVDIATYQLYHGGYLYTRLGDDRGFGPEHDLARARIVATLEGLGLPVALEPFQYFGTTYYNIVATQVGLDDPDTVVVVGAHFDSVNNPGADDNATGTALVMEVARVLSAHRSPVTIRYVLFDREEQGLVGSSAFVADHAGENIVLACIADMVGHDSGAYAMDLYGTAASSSVMNGLVAAIDTYGAGLGRTSNVGTFAFSDHWPFESAGIPACVIIEDCYTCNDYYHTQSDAVDIEPGYISYGMIDDLLHSVVGYLVDEAGITMHGDVNDDAQVDVNDLLAVLGAWGACDPPCPPRCGEDTNGDCVVDVTDLLTVLGHWG